MDSFEEEFLPKRAKISGLEGDSLQVYSMTDKGKKRELNEDYIYTSGKPIGALPNLFIVADGMGGHNAGDYASKHTVEKMVEAIEAYVGETQNANVILAKAIEQANTYIYQCAKKSEQLSGMGTTLVVATCIDDMAIIANVGDSRLYLVTEASIKQVTRDHSLVEEMISLGGIDRETARNHPDKNIITRAIGVKESVLADFFEVKLEKGDKLLLCSDGLTNMLCDDEIHQIITKQEQIEQATKALIDAANENGGRDNIAVVLVEPFGGCK